MAKSFIIGLVFIERFANAYQTIIFSRGKQRGYYGTLKCLIGLNNIVCHTYYYDSFVQIRDFRHALEGQVNRRDGPLGLKFKYAIASGYPFLPGLTGCHLQCTLAAQDE